MFICFIIALFLVASYGAYVFFPNRGIGGFIASMLTVGGFLSLVYMTKLIIMMA